jgi:LacI family transcriptional regulator
MSVTQKDIAERLNISQSQVARALSGRSAGRSAVSAETRQRIEAVAREMGYVFGTNHGAREMAARRHGNRIHTGAIAVLYPTLEGTSLRQLPFFSPVLDGMESEAVVQGLDIFMCMVRHKEVPRLIRDGGVDGVISISGVAPEMRTTQAVYALDIPIVTFQSSAEGAGSVMPDDRGGAYLATRHLIELGHRHIAFLGIESPGYAETCIARLEGYRDAMREAGIQVRDEWIENSLPYHSTQVGAYCPGCDGCACCRGFDRLLERNPEFLTAIVCYNDPVAMGTVVRARAHGLAVPHDLSVVGFDNTSEQYHFLPTITSVNIQRYEMGQRCVRLLNELITHEVHRVGNGTEHQIVFPVNLALHESTAKPGPHPTALKKYKHDHKTSVS